MLHRWPIRNKLLIGLCLLLIVLSLLSTSGFVTTYAYRGLVRSLSSHSAELPLATKLSQYVGNLRVTQTRIRPLPHIERSSGASRDSKRISELRGSWETDLALTQRALQRYQEQLEDSATNEYRLGGINKERETALAFQGMLDDLRQINEDPNWMFDATLVERVTQDVERLQELAIKLPSFLTDQIHQLAWNEKVAYRTVIVTVWLTTIGAGVMLLVLVTLFYRWVFRPLRQLVTGSRRVAAGDFDYRIQLDNEDEMAELADAMNDMTSRFQAIRDDLDNQVQIRTTQVVRSEQLASVGFLAAGVAHEINNPLASIALSAESLEGRLPLLGIPQSDEADVMRRYLRMIQAEAFRCKEITEKLLDFSRTGEVKRSETDLKQIVDDVVEMIGHLGKYRGKRIEFTAPGPTRAWINPQEIKQVVLNLVTNALDSLDDDGMLRIELQRRATEAVLTFTDNGCGMTEEVLSHLFEPFFTRRRGGQGTGLGLSIVYRIVADHEGHIDASSAGPGQGSQFRVALPLVPASKENSHRYQAA